MNEVQGMAKKALRGAGLHWGVAEDGARAVRWLCEQGEDGVGALARLLEAYDPTSCPVQAGLAVSDHALSLADEEHLSHLAHPLLIVPFVAFAAQQRGEVLSVTAEGWTATTDGAGLEMQGTAPDQIADLTVRQGGALTSPQQHQTRADPDPAAWQILTDLAHRTYAPATEESRRLGAGAGTTDND